MPITKSILRTIEARDPDGGTRPPTDADYIAFRTWVTNTYGQAAWSFYVQGGWGGEWYA